MAHIIETIENQPFQSALAHLKAAHAFIADRVIQSQKTLSLEKDCWGMAAKRMIVDLSDGPQIVGKKQEKFVEIINILATTERTIDAIKWLSDKYPYLRVRECHASTSDREEGNDIVLIDSNGNVEVRCEVCDVVSRKPNQNNKEKKDLKKLGCYSHVPADGVRRYIATSKEFALTLTSTKRKWAKKHYRYESTPTELPHRTYMLAIIDPWLNK